MIKFDDLDAKILNQLLQNGRESLMQWKKLELL